MSLGKDLIRLLSNIKYKSVSKIDMQYNKIFKGYSLDSLLYHQIFANKVRKKWSNDYIDPSLKAKSRSTNDKLMQLINANKNTSKIQETFFQTTDQESILNQLNKKENSSDKLTSKKYSKAALSKKIINIIENRKKFNVSNEFIQRRHEENNRRPPICLYTPKYNYIYKNMPNFYFYREKNYSKKRNDGVGLDLYKKFNRTKDFNISNIEEGNLIGTNKIGNIKHYNHSMHFLTPIHLSNNKSCSSFFGTNDDKDKSKEIEEKKNSSKKKVDNFFLSQLGASSQSHDSENNISHTNNANNIRSEYTPKIIEKNKLVPNFDKMIPRYKKRRGGVPLRNLNYSPNYDAIFSNVLNNKPIDYEKRRKHYFLKKIISTFNVTSEYLLFPELNSKNSSS